MRLGDHAVVVDALVHSIQIDLVRIIGALVRLLRVEGLL